MNPTPLLSNKDFEFLSSLIREETGICLSEQKQALLMARLQARLRELNLNDFHQYCQLLRARKTRQTELPHLINRITTNETYFYRSEKHFAFLQQEVLAQLQDRDFLVKPLRIWSAGCSSGEEVYTIAILVQETLPAVPPGGIRILGTDIDTEVLQQAKNGRYPARKLEKLPPLLRKKYFQRVEWNGQPFYQVRPELRRLVAFRQHNLLKDPPPVRNTVDCVFCRNVLIYFRTEEQQQAIENLTVALRPGGYLFLGHSESLIRHPQLELLQHAIFQKRGDHEPAF